MTISFCQCKFFITGNEIFNLNGTKFFKLVIFFAENFRYFVIKQVCLGICIFSFRKMELKFEVTIEMEGRLDCKIFVIKVEKKVDFWILYLVLL